MLGALVVPTVFLVATSCTNADSLGMGRFDDGAMPDQSFVAPDATTPIPAEGGLIDYCPSKECPFPYATCSKSKFLCEIDLSSDPSNCGACGQACPTKERADFRCVSGRCAMSCKERHVDCNGILDDDCEVRLGTNENCGACGDRCPDPAKPCIFDEASNTGRCGCIASEALCEGACVDVQNTDDKCGGCEIACDVSGGGKDEPPPHMHYGCVGGVCEKLKCDANWADCDKNLANGCESSLFDSSTCGSCSNACESGQVCGLDRRSNPYCQCPKGKTLCDGTCTDLDTDPFHCGACGFNCSHAVTGLDTSHAMPLCTYGSCGATCYPGWSDCNDDLEDGCETFVNADPRHCGACGNACMPGQACAGGQCVVEPCPTGPEPETAR